MRVFEVSGSTLYEGQRFWQFSTVNHFIREADLRSGDRLVVVPAGKMLPEMNHAGGEVEINALTAKVHDLEDTIQDLHATIGWLSADLREAKAQPTVKELCRAYGELLKRVGRISTKAVMDMDDDGSGAVYEYDDHEFGSVITAWEASDNPVAVIDAACRPVAEPEPVALPLVQVWTT